MEKLNYKEHLFFSLFSEGFFGKRVRTVQRPKGGVPQPPKNSSATPEKHKEKSVKKNCVAYS